MNTKLTACALIAAGVLAAQERFDLQVRNYFFAGFSGDTDSLKKGMQICEDLLKTNPKQAEAMVWHGSGLFFESGQAFQGGDQQKGQALWTKGMQEMDSAVQLAPKDLGVRIPRGAVLLTASQNVPPQMAKPLIEKGLSDFETAYEIQQSSFDTLGVHPRGELMIGLADGYSRIGDQEKARAWFERIQKDLKGTAYEKSAETWLAGKPLSARQAGCLGCHTGN